MEVSAILLFSLVFVNSYAAELDTISDSRFLTNEDTLVSATGIFELGFFQPGSSGNRYLGIWYKNISVRTVVWVANRNRPQPDASPLELKIADQGILGLFNNTSMIWSSNTTTTGNATAKLRDNGNLVVIDQDEKVVWQSFDYPTDTLLPGMKLGRDYLRHKEWYLTPWKSSQDPAPGELTWGSDPVGYPENKLRQGSLVMLRAGPWANQRFVGISAFSVNLTFTYDMIIDENEASISYNLENSSLLSRSTLNSSMLLENWAWVENGTGWQRGAYLPRGECDKYNICNAYGACSINMTQQSCSCLDEKRFVPKNQKAWDTANWSDGCVRRTPLECKNGSEGFIKYSNVKLPDTENTWFNMSMSLEECGATCLKNCSYSQSISKDQGGENIKIILLVTIPGVLLIGLIIVTWLCYARRKRFHAKPTGEVGILKASKGQEEDIEQSLFSFSIIANATANFSPDNKLGEGGFGPVYKGMLEDGREIAVKRLSKNSTQGLDEFKNEVICISKLQHRNLVKLHGCCIQGDEKLLIYEYMPNKSLDSFIFDKTQSMLLDWTNRFNIIKGIARGLLYLHQDSRLRIIHRDLKASNILLDHDMNPKISDFGLARSFGGNETQANTERVVGTYGYMSPEYALDGVFSIKSDVFSFGVMVLEIVSGKRNRGFIQPENEINLIGHVWRLYNEGKSLQIIDASCAESCHFPEVIRSIRVGLLCVQPNARDRPKMSSVILMLGNEGELQEPKQPSFLTEKPVVNYSSSSYTAGSTNQFTITEVYAR
ncbi:hypothetical protein E3N88_09222 [Mikania micrantha]|uniref:Receptor-like serine/threonine-protein kinase n=1 Tax=Mikania micrantha TaxID=192012 RepID=A0A5N6PKN3_9ASTR|nr:hypothetical protein E3N88_09222 [Mikania micrantha]